MAFPKNANMRLVMKMMRGEPLRPGEELQMVPVFMTDKKGDKFAPAFTSRERIRELKDFPHILRVPAAQVIDNLLKTKGELAGVLVDPQTGGFILRPQAFTDDLSKAPQQQMKKVSRDEFVVIARASVEKMQIPQQLFERKGGFVEELEDRGEEFMVELYAKPYGDKVPSPYSEEQFSVLSLGIDEDTTAVCLELPKKGLSVGMARAAYIIWNEKTDEVHYYLIEKGQKDEEDVLCNITPEGVHQELMSAPPVGSELTAVLELIKEENEEA